MQKYEQAPIIEQAPIVQRYEQAPIIEQAPIVQRYEQAPIIEQAPIVQKYETGPLINTAQYNQYEPVAQYAQGPIVQKYETGPIISSAPLLSGYTTKTYAAPAPILTASSSILGVGPSAYGLGATKGYGLAPQQLLNSHLSPAYASKSLSGYVKK